MEFKKDLTTLLKARNTAILVQSKEERRAVQIIKAAGFSANYLVREWTCFDGITEDGKPLNPSTQDPTEALKYVSESNERYLYIFKDLDGWFNPIINRALKSIAQKLQGVPVKEGRIIVLLSSQSTLPPDLSFITVMDLPLADREEVGKLLDDTMEAARAAHPEIKAIGDNGEREKAINSALGLTVDEISNSYSKSLVSKKEIDPAVIVREKKRVISREKLMDWYDPDPRGLDGVRGLNVLKPWLVMRKSAFSEKARLFGLPAPKGVMLVGVPGCGKSLTAKCVASTWEVPLIRLDLGALKSKYVGESEQNIRQALKVSEAVAPCVLWLDEIEKALAGSTGPQGDGGVSSDALGCILNWMQEKQAGVFVVATANQVENLPPELLRKGRFDELFFVDLPNPLERKDILAVTLEQFKRDPATIDLEKLSSVTEGFTGAEIAALVPEALFVAFNDEERNITTDDLVIAAQGIVPLSKTAQDKIEGLRKWAKGRARPASSYDETVASSERVIEF